MYNSIKSTTKLYSIILLFFLGNILYAQKNATKFQNDVFISNWSVCGPFSNTNGKNIDTDFLINEGGENQLVLTPSLTHSSESVPSGIVGWMDATTDENGKLDIKKNLSPNQRNVAYCAAYIECDEITPAILKLGSNDRLKVWLNGKVVHIFSEPRAGGPDTDQLPVELQKGKNLLLAKVDNEGGNWWLYARFQQLESIDGEMFMTTPLISSIPKKTSDGTIADIFNIMLFNTSSEPSGPVSLKVKESKSRPELEVITPKMGSKEYQWITLESLVDINKSKEFLQMELQAKTEKGSKTFKLKTERQNILDGSTYFIQGFHVDPVWRDSQSGYQTLSFSNMTQHLNAVVSDPSYGLFISEIPYLKPYYDSYPKKRALIRQLVKEGRIETGGSYNQPNETSISGEALIRNILYGRLFHENILGDYPRVYAPWDVFGHIIQLPQILTKSEFIGTTWERGNYRSPFVRVPDVPDLYRAMSPDGTTILNRKVRYGFSGPQTGQYHDVDLQTRKIFSEKLVEQQEQIPDIKYDIRINAMDEKAPTSWMVGKTSEFKTYIPEVSTQSDGAEQYIRGVKSQFENFNLDIPVVSRDVSQYNEGCELSRFDLKKGNRLAENTLISAEKFATITNLMGYKYPALELDKAWRQLLYGQHHDGITGCGADQPYLDLVEAYHEALELSWNALEESLIQISDNVNTADQKGKPIIIYNPLNWKRSDVVKESLEFENGLEGFKIIDENGQEIKFIIEDQEEKDGLIYKAVISFIAKEVPSIGYKTYWIVDSKRKSNRAQGNKVNTNTIENDYFKLTVDKNSGGGITSLIDKKSGKEFIKSSTGHPGNELILMKEGDGYEPAWRFITTGEKSFSKDKSCEIEVFENQLYKKIVIRGEMDNMEKRVQEIIVYNDIQRIDFKTSLVGYTGQKGQNIIENDESERSNDRDFYAIGFPANLDGGVPVLEDRFATKTYYKSKDYLTYHSIDTEWTSHHAMNSCNQWIDYSNSVKINFGNAGSIALGPVEVLTTHSEKLRKSGFELIETLAKRGITATPSFDDVVRDYDIQYRRFSFSIGIEGKSAYNNKLINKFSKKQKEQYKKSLNENGYTYLFAYDSEIEGSWFDLPVLMIVGVDEKSLDIAVNNIIEELNMGSELNFPASICYSEVENEVPDYGLTIFNKGNLPVSIEPDGTMVLSLMHTIPWQSPLLNWTHDFPERKTHVFEYAILPHQGNWRNADLVKEGYEYNNPLIAIQTDSHKGDYPTLHSFFSTKGKSAIITALKPKSNGNEAFKANTATDASNGVIVRMYEPYGNNGTVKLISDFSINDAKKVNMMERKPEDISFTPKSVNIEIKSNAIETFALNLEGIEKYKNEISSIEEPKTAVYAQFWQHNTGAAPTGYLPVSIKILGNLKSFTETKSIKTIQQIEIAVVNDYTDSAVSGKVKIQTPPDLRVIPSEIEYTVGANSEKFYPVSIVPESNSSEAGFIVASLEHQDITVYDVLEYNLPEKKFGHSTNKNATFTKLNWDIEEKDDEIELTITNPFAQAVMGDVSLIGPVETWGMKKVNMVSLNEVSPWKKAFEVPGRSTQIIHFKINSDTDTTLKKGEMWLVAKLSYFGYLDYKAVVGELEIEE